MIQRKESYRKLQTNNIPHKYKLKIFVSGQPFKFSYVRTEVTQQYSGKPNLIPDPATVQHVAQLMELPYLQGNGYGWPFMWQ